MSKRVFSWCVPFIFLVIYVPFCGLAEKTRTITILLAPDQSIRALEKWQETVQERVHAVSRIYEKEFNLQWKISGFREWNSNDLTLDPCELIDDLARKIDPGGSEVILGIYRRDRPSRSGCTKPFTRVVVTLDENNAPENWKMMILAHELAHLFGAWHSDDPQTLMSGSNKSTLTFDEQSRQVIRLARRFDFRKGFAGISSSTQTEISATFRRGHAAGEIDPVSIGYVQLGNSLHVRGKLDGSESEYRKAIEIDGGNFVAHDNLGTVLGEKGDLDAAISEHTRAIQLNSSYPLAHNNLGVSLMQTGRTEQAIDEFREAVHLNRNYVDALYNLGDALFKRGDLFGSMREMRQVIRLAPEHGNAHAFLAVLLYYSGSYREAWEEVFAARRLGGNIRPAFVDLLREKMPEPRN